MVKETKAYYLLDWSYCLTGFERLKKGMSLSAARSTDFVILTTQQTRDVKPTLFQCWASVADSGLTLKENLANISCLLGIYGADIWSNIVKENIPAGAYH